MSRATLLVLAFIAGVLSSEDDSSGRWANANNVFGINLLKALPPQVKHVFLSPLSLSVAMAMVYHGARGVSERELTSVLGYEAAGLRGREDVLSAMRKSLSRVRLGINNNVAVDIANALLVSKKFPVAESYRKDVQDVFRALFKEVDFAEESAGVVSEVNEWVSTKTRGKINRVVSELPQRAALFVMNAVYLKGDWKTEFLAGRTTRLPFYNYGVRRILVDTMEETNRYSYAKNDELNADIVELPYQGNQFSMVIFLPRDRNGLNALIAGLTAAKIQNAVSHLVRTNVNLWLPKFKLESDYSLVRELKGLGAASIFTDNANLTGINESGNLTLSDVIHKAAVEVNEKGSEAAVFTGFIFVPRINVRRKIEYFHVDHPFFFLIRHKLSDTIFFMGTVNELTSHEPLTTICRQTTMLGRALLVLALTAGAFSSSDESSLRLAEANNILGVNLLKALPANKNHLFISPFSVNMAMSMVYHGARGVSERELSRTLGYEAAGFQGREGVLSAMLNFFQDASLQSNDVTLEVANAVLVNESFPLVGSYKKDLQDVYRAVLKEVNFLRDSRAVVSEINEWVSQKTRGKIDNVISSLPADTVLFIMNAVYFKGDWTTKFLESQTTKLPFYNRGEASKLVDTMRGTNRYRYGSDYGLKADIVELPYKGDRFSMLILLPHERNGLSQLVEELTASKLHGAVSNLYSTKVVLSLPKFKLESKYSLVEQLKDLGAKSIFDGRANLTGISESANLVVSDVIHKAVVEVNEQGSEAAAFTGVVITTYSSSSFQIEFNVDHPFLFFIRDKRTNMILFTGAVNEL
ncbi:uncharacterized protein LOC135395950 [Ornithodoros turicata]|uniref:uncharacterized protein LOC135395950 n=1 Tax=Ornithodoros turicata TaxID=34597 RepID=UPI003139B6C9